MQFVMCVHAADGTPYAGSLVFVLACVRNGQAALAGETARAHCSSLHVQSNGFFLFLSHFLFHSCLMLVVVHIYSAKDFF